MANWKEPKKDYVPEDQVVPEIFNVLAENEIFLNETKITTEEVQDSVVNSVTNSTREDVGDKETVKGFFSKVRKWLADLKALAFKGTVGTNDIDNLAINASKIDTNAVTASKIANNAVETSKIKDSAVTDAKISSVSVSKVSGLHKVATSGSYNDLIDKPEIGGGGVQFRKIKGNDARYDAFELSNDARYTLEAQTNYSNPILVQGMLTCGSKYWVSFILKERIPWSYGTSAPQLFYIRSVNGQANTSYGFLSLDAKISGKTLTISGYKINQNSNNIYSSSTPASKCYFALDSVYEIVIEE